MCTAYPILPEVTKLPVQVASSAEHACRYPRRRDRSRDGSFWNKVDASGDCWLWTAGRFATGYGAYWQAGRTLKAHRVAYELLIGSLGVGDFVLHHCDNPPCVNPAHLFVGTKKDNALDAVEKGRKYLPSPKRALTDEQVARIRAMRAAGHTLAEVAAAVGCHWVTVSNVARGKSHGRDRRRREVSAA